MTTPAKRPEPVLDAAKVAGATAAVILSVGALLRGVGWLPVHVDVQALADQASSVVLAVGILWAAIGPWLLARLRARDQVTPLEDPRDQHGRPLVASQLAAMILRYPELAAEAKDKLDAGLAPDIVMGHLVNLSRALPSSSASRTGAAA